MIKLSRFLSEYMNSKAVFALDVLTALISSIIVLFTVNFISHSIYYSGPFALWWLGGCFLISSFLMIVMQTYKVIIRYTGIDDIKKYVLGIFSANVLLGVLLAFTCTFNRTVLLMLLANFFLTLILTLGERFIMIDVYKYYKAKIKDATKRQRILVYGTSEKSVAAIARFMNSNHYLLQGFITINPVGKDFKLAGYPVIYCRDEGDFIRTVDNLSLSAILFTTDNDVKAEENGIVKYCTDNGLKVLITPAVDEITGGDVNRNVIRQIRVEDLLGRPEIKISLNEIKSNFRNKVVMVTGAAGSIGSELCRQLAGFGVKMLILYDNAETPMHNIRLELEARFPELVFVPVIGSVRHENRLDYAFRHWMPQIVFHAAAYKHVPLMEENPCEAVFANVHGSRMVADKCVEYGVEMMVMISTDKAVNPTNIMGCSKRLAEIYVQSLGLALASGEIDGKTKFVTTRFGNVLGSNGSVIPRFREQIENGGPVTVTHPEITRFFMTIPEACRLVMDAATISTGNQIFVFDMGNPVKIADLAKKMIELAGLKVGEDIQIEYTGLRPGEKLYEEVLASTENTDPTTNDRIRVARVREYDYKEAVRVVDELTTFAKAVNIPEMVRLMKKVVPEFKSNNSRFEAYDQ